MHISVGMNMLQATNASWKYEIEWDSHADKIAVDDSCLRVHAMAGWRMFMVMIPGMCKSMPQMFMLWSVTLIMIQIISIFLSWITSLKLFYHLKGVVGIKVPKLLVKHIWVTTHAIQAANPFNKRHSLAYH